MKINQAARLIAKITGVNESDVETRARHLRIAGFLPSGLTGKNAPDFGYREITVLLIGLMSGDTVSSVADGFDNYLNLSSRSGMTLWEGISRFDKLIEKAIENHDVAESINSVTVCRTVPQASIEWTPPGNGCIDDSRICQFFLKGYDNSLGGFSISASISGIVLRHLCEAL